MSSPWMEGSTIFQAPPQAAFFLWSCDKVYHKQEVCFLLYFLGQIVSWRYNPNLLDWNWPCTVINDHNWQLWNCPFNTAYQFLEYLSLRWSSFTKDFVVFLYCSNSCLEQIRKRHLYRHSFNWFILPYYSNRTQIRQRISNTASWIVFPQW